MSPHTFLTMRFLHRFLLPILLINNMLAIPTVSGYATSPSVEQAPPKIIGSVETKIRLNATTSPDRRYLAYEIYGSSLFIEAMETGEVRDLGEGNRPVWDDAGRLHFMTVIENDDHSEEVIYHVFDPATDQRSVLPEWVPRPEFVPPSPTVRQSRAKRMVPSTASVSGLSGWSIFLDQGHSQKENQGLYNYSEAEKVLRIGLHLRQMLLQQTDIDTVFLARTNDTDLVGLTQRTSLANALGADFYYSIHSNAGAPGTNNTLMLWGANGAGVEKTPQGGKKMGDIMIQDLTVAMRIPTIGSRADSPFYGATTRTTPYLSVNRNSTMPSVLSEGGFHTNPTQQQRNLNAEWKKLEAQSAFWSILRYHGLSRPKVGILTGIVSNVETGRPINGAQVRVGDRTYTTDTFESLFSRYSNNPNELANGFYYLESFTPGATLEVEISAPGFYPQTASVSLQDTTFTFLDRGLVSSVPPSIAAFNAPDLQDERIRIRFSRPMRRDSTEAAVSILPSVPMTFQWVDDATLAIQTGPLTADTEYTVSVSTLAEDRYEHALQTPYNAVFRTAPPDLDPPQITSVWPAASSSGVVQRPIITFEFNERLDPASITNESIVVNEFQTDAAYRIAGIVRYVERGNRSVLQFFPSADLRGNTLHLASAELTIQDVAGNRLAASPTVQFSTHESQRTYTSLATFEGSALDSWWVPQQSGSTSGIITEVTSRATDDVVVNPLFGSARSMRLNYGFQTNGSGLIRLYIGGASSALNPRFTSAGLLETYIHGDGSGTLFRFMVRDASGHLEGSPWTTITWLGWRRVQWDMRTETPVAWAGGANGVLDGTLYTDSYQLMPSMSSALVGEIRFDDTRFVTVVSETSVDRGPETVDRVELAQNYPNPFNPSTVIGFRLSGAHMGMPVRLAIYDVLGRQVAVLIDGAMPAGTHQITFNGEGLSSGVYLVRLVAGSEVRTMRMLLLK